MNDSQFLALRLDVHCMDEPTAVRACETLTRAMLGLPLDGMNANLTVTRVELPDDAEAET